MYFVDPDGMQAEHIGFDKNMSAQDRANRLSDLQKLTNDKLSYNSTTNQVEISSRGKGSKSKGTQLIRDLISHDKTVTIGTDSRMPGATTESVNGSNDPNKFNGVGSDVEIVFGGSHATLNKDSKTGKSVVEMMPSQITLGHELSHALGMMDGASISLSRESLNYYKGSDGGQEWEKTAVEELMTTGVEGFNRSSNSKRSYYTTENDLRKEAGLNVRVAYKSTGWTEKQKKNLRK